MNRNLAAQPYTVDEQRVVDVMKEVSGGRLFLVDDPIGTLIGVAARNTQFMADFLRSYLTILVNLIESDDLDDADKIGLKMAFMAMKKLIESQGGDIGVGVSTQPVGHA
jgi:hypothetical protein